MVYIDCHIPHTHGMGFMEQDMEWINECIVALETVLITRYKADVSITYCIRII
jgi:hypothetical protein